MLNIKLHKGQRKVYSDKRKVRVVVCGRRWGKSKLTVYELLLRSLTFSGKVDPVSTQTVLGVLPTLAAAKRILWQPLLNLCTQTALSEAVEHISKVDFKITFKGGKPPIVISSTEGGGDRLRGMRLYFVCMDEYQDMAPGTLDQVIMPATADTQGSKILITGTPKGKNNVLFEVADRAIQFPHLYSFFNMPTWTNPTIDKAEVETARLTLPPRSFRQEYMAEFCDFPGKIFTELDENNLVTTLPDSYDFTLLGVDWGECNPAFVVLGRRDNKWYYVDGYAPDSDQPIAPPMQDAEILRLAKKYQPRQVFCDPSRPASILHLRNLGKDNGLVGLSKAVAGYNRIEDGLDQVHSLLYQNRLLFPKDPVKRYSGQLTGIEAYQQFSDYHRKTDKNGMVTDQVEDGQRDHAIDAIRYLLAVKTGGL